MAFSAEIRARLGLDTTTFTSELVKAGSGVAKFGDDAARAVKKKFSGADLFRGLVQGLGIASAQQIAEKLVEPFRASAESAKNIAEWTDRSAHATERLIALRQNDLQQLAAMEKQFQRLQEESGKAASIGFWRGAAGTLAAKFGMNDLSAKLLSNEDANAEKQARNAAELAEKALEIEAKKQAIKKQGDVEALRSIKEQLNEEDKRAEAVRRLADFEREQRREKMDAAQLINDLERERRTVAQQVANYEKAQREGIVLTSQGVGELLDLKERQASIEERIAAVTERKAAAEADALKTIERQNEALRIGFEIRGRDNIELTDRELQAKQRNLSQQLLNTQLLDMGPTGLNLFGSSLITSQDVLKGFKERELAAIQREMDLRQGLNRNRSFFGEDRAFEMSGLTEREFAQRTRGLTDNEKFISELEKLRREQERSLQAIAETLKSIR